ncbi:DUF3626 domain-containing protein [Gallicola sp. Sow4_E12]|uniref:DUF3626 domain-containing protein n=1 Tax=Gallicola sp. Sow4_E12 TaxID=3438785 RepID=UPI003F8FC9DA
MYLVENHHEAIISHEDFEAVEAILNQRAKEKGIEKRNSKYLNRYSFSGKIICSECGSTFKRRIHSSGRRKYIAWCCSKHISQIGRNLDYCIETHIHGDVHLLDDVDSFYMDESYQKTTFEEKANELCHRYGIKLKWIPKRQIKLEEIGDLFRGPMIPLLAKKIDTIWGNNQGVMNAALLGKAPQDSEHNPEKWNDIGSQSEVFQYIKQLWHTIGYFG